MSCRILLRCVGMAVLDKGLRGLLKETPFAGYLIDIATSAYDHFQRECRENREFQAIQSKVDKTLDAVSDGASKVFANIQKQSNPENKGSVELREIESAACATMDEIKVEAREVLAEIRRQAAPELRAKLDDPILQNNMLGYLEQIPGTVRASLKRPSDPSGKSLPKGFALSSADDFLKILPTQPPRFKAGDMPVGNWKLLDLLGVGGFGEVWKAEHPSLKGIPPVALKFCLSPDSARFLRHEGELLSRVMEVSANNPGIVKLRQAYIESDTPCLEYEFINGGDLCGLMSEWLNMAKERRTLLALQMLLKLARTIAPLHTMNPPIVHRDLKPANVLVVRTTDGKINLKIGDFGIGGLATKQAIEGQSKGASQGEILTQTLRGSHTPLYAGPEQQRGDPPHPTDDVHALGVIGFQLLVCDLRRGPTGDWDEELRELGVSDPIIAMFKQCIARQARRYPHAGALADELQNLIDSKPSTAAKPALPVPPVPAAIQANSSKEAEPILAPATLKSKHRSTTKNNKIKSPKKSGNKAIETLIIAVAAIVAVGIATLAFPMAKTIEAESKLEAINSENPFPSNNPNQNPKISISNASKITANSTTDFAFLKKYYLSDISQAACEAEQPWRSLKADQNLPNSFLLIPFSAPMVAFARYDIDSWTAFSSKVRLNNDPKSSVMFAIRSNNIIAWQSRELNNKNEIDECWIDTRNSKNIELLVRCKGISDSAQAIWEDPHFIKTNDYNQRIKESAKTLNESVSTDYWKKSSNSTATITQNSQSVKQKVKNIEAFKILTKESVIQNKKYNISIATSTWDWASNKESTEKLKKNGFNDSKTIGFLSSEQSKDTTHLLSFFNTKTNRSGYILANQIKWPDADIGIQCGWVFNKRIAGTIPVAIVQFNSTVGPTQTLIVGDETIKKINKNTAQIIGNFYIYEKDPNAAQQ